MRKKIPDLSSPEAYRIMQQIYNEGEELRKERMAATYRLGKIRQLFSEPMTTEEHNALKLERKARRARCMQIDAELRVINAQRNSVRPHFRMQFYPAFFEIAKMNLDTEVFSAIARSAGERIKKS